MWWINTWYLLLAALRSLFSLLASQGPLPFIASGHGPHSTDPWGMSVSVDLPRETGFLDSFEPVEAITSL